MLQSGPQVSCKRCSDRNTDAEPWRECNQEKKRYIGEKTIRKKEDKKGERLCKEKCEKMEEKRGCFWSFNLIYIYL